MKTIFASTVLILTLLSQVAWAAPEVHFLWSRDSARVLESHSAAIATPVENPPNAVQWKWDRVDSQDAIKTVFPQGRKVISPTRVERANGQDAADLSEVDLRESISKSRRPLLSDN